MRTSTFCLLLASSSLTALSSCGNNSNVGGHIADVLDSTRIDIKKAELKEYTKTGIGYRDSIKSYQYEDASADQVADIGKADQALKSWANAVVSKLQATNQSSPVEEANVSSRETELKNSIATLKQKYGTPSSSSSIITDPTQIIASIINKAEFQQSLNEFKLAMRVN
jgi:hypothetical protein